MNNMKVANFPAPRDKPLEYPGKRPPFSYLSDGKYIYEIRFRKTFQDGIVYYKGRWEGFDKILKDLTGAKLKDRHPILAYGSNSCPGQLLNKFKNRCSVVVPVIKGYLENMDTVYGCSILYGSIPAVLVKSLGTKVECWMTFLDSEQYEIMDETEQVGEDYYVKEFGNFFTDFGQNIKSRGYWGLMKRYIGQDGNLVALKEIIAKKRKFPEKSQFEINHSIMNRENMKRFLMPFNIKNVPDFVARLKNDEIFRDDVNKILRENYCSI